MKRIMNKPILSIIIPLFNSSSFIEKTISNIFSNTNIDRGTFEILLINDGSTDDTQMVCENLSLKYQNIKYFNKKNEGIASTRNFGINQASGDFIFFHDHDDLMCADNLKQIIDLVNSNQNIDIFFFNSYFSKASDIQPLVKNNPAYLGPHINDVSFNESLFLNLCHFNQKNKITERVGYIWTCIISKEFVLKNNISFHRFVNYEDDYLFFFDSLVSNPNTFFSDIFIYKWVVNINSTSATYKFDKAHCDNLLILNDYLEKRLPLTYERRDEIINNVMWGFWFDFLVFYCKKNPNPSFKEFKSLCKKYNVRDHMISCKNRVIKKKQKILILLFKMRLLRFIYCSFIKH